MESCPPPHAGAGSIAAGPGGGLLAQITAGVAEGDDLSGLLRRFLEPIVRVAGARGGSVKELVEPGRFDLRGSLDMPLGQCGAVGVMDSRCGTCGRSAISHKLVWADDLTGCQDEMRSAMQERGWDRLLAVPLLHRGKTLGVYNLFYDRSQAPPGPEVCRLLQSIGELLGLALDHQRIAAAEFQARVNEARHQMAAEVHDSVAQSVTFMKMRLALLDGAIAAGDLARARRYCDELQGVASEAHAGLRTLISHLRADSKPLHLARALEERIGQLRVSTGMTLQLHNDCPELVLTPPRVADVFNVIQEAVSNVIHHAQARWARVVLRDAGQDRIEVVIEDDGTGLPADRIAIDGHFGLAIMQERAQRLQGELTVSPRDEGGTCVRMVFPRVAGPGGSA